MDHQQAIAVEDEHDHFEEVGRSIGTDDQDLGRILVNPELHERVVDGVHDVVDNHTVAKSGPVDLHTVES